MFCPLEVLPWVVADGVSVIQLTNFRGILVILRNLEGILVNLPSVFGNS